MSLTLLSEFTTRADIGFCFVAVHLFQDPLGGLASLHSRIHPEVLPVPQSQPSGHSALCAGSAALTSARLRWISTAALQGAGPGGALRRDSLLIVVWRERWVHPTLIGLRDALVGRRSRGWWSAAAGVCARAVSRAAGRQPSCSGAAPSCGGAMKHYECQRLGLRKGLCGWPASSDLRTPRSRCLDGEGVGSTVMPAGDR
ncbi:hypothetical protein NN561_017246 [Cricetulus griseus]